MNPVGSHAISERLIYYIICMGVICAVVNLAVVTFPCVHCVHCRVAIA